MFDVCCYHQTSAANNSCSELLEDILFTLSPAEVDGVNSWDVMEMITVAFEILFKYLGV